jgi:hypothetical protein
MENISNNDNMLYPIDLSIFKEHVKLSLLNILDNVSNILLFKFLSFQKHKKP